MIIKYSEFINENINKARRVLRETNKLETDKDFIELRELLRNNAGYLGKFTEWHFVDKIPLDRLKNLYNTISGVRLSNPIDSFKTPEEIIDIIIRQRASTAVNQIVNAIPSRTREQLSSSEVRISCEKCYASGAIDCDVCDASGAIDCKTCHRELEIECNKCNGSGLNIGGSADNDDECTKCHGSGVMDCTACDGNGETSCKKCNGEGYSDCKECNGNGEIIKKGNEAWNDFLGFLSLHADKKDRIISFLARKGGRYDDIESLKNDISELINAIQIEDIQRISRDKSDPNMEFIYENEKIIVIAVNFEGVKKYGSSYWCITQDEDTFDGYANEGESIQFIIYFKGKEPLVDEHSVMGVTMGISNKEIEAAHWEDDDEADEDYVKELFGKKKSGRPKKGAKPLETENILKGVNIEKIAKKLYRISEFNSPKYFNNEHYVDDLKEIKDISQIEDMIVKFFKYQEDIEENYVIFEFIEAIDKKIKKSSIGKLNATKVRQNTRLDTIDIAIGFGIDNFNFDPEWLKLSFEDINDSISEANDFRGDEIEQPMSVYVYFHKNGYVFDTPSKIKEISEEDDDLIHEFITRGILSLENHWDKIPLDHTDTKEMEWILVNKVKKGVQVTERLRDQLVHYLMDVSQIDKYKKFVLDFLDSKTTRSDVDERKRITDKILELTDDDDIAEKCLDKLIPTKHKGKFSLSRIKPFPR